MAAARFTPIVGTLGYVWDRPSDRVLMIRRNARPDDDQFGKMNGLGGKLEPDEGVTAGMRRELGEEATIDVTSMLLRGTVTWTNFGPKREQWLGFVFRIDGWTGTVPATNEEGSLEWIDREQLLAACHGDATAQAAVPMWPGDRHFLPMVFDADARQFHGTMPYDGDTPVTWQFERL